MPTIIESPVLPTTPPRDAEEHADFAAFCQRLDYTPDPAARFHAELIEAWRRTRWAQS